MPISEEMPTWRDLQIGCTLVEPGSASRYKTGDWRSLRPIWDHNKCIKCGICYIFCPDACIEQDAEGYFEANLYWCKGCGICTRECPTGVITMVEEQE